MSTRHVTSPLAQEDPYSSIHAWYLAMSFEDTLFLHLFNASSKSFIVTGRSTSSFLICLISAGLRPDIFLRMAIMAASRHTLLISAAVYPSSLSAMMFVSRLGSITTLCRQSFSSRDRVSSSKYKYH